MQADNEFVKELKAHLPIEAKEEDALMEAGEARRH